PPLPHSLQACHSRRHRARWVHPHPGPPCKSRIRSVTLRFASTCPRAVDLTASMRAWQHVKRTRRRKTSTARQTRIRARRVHGNSSSPQFRHGLANEPCKARPSGRALCFNSLPPDISLASFRTRSTTMEARLDNYKDLRLKLDGLVPPGHGFHRNLL